MTTTKKTGKNGDGKTTAGGAKATVGDATKKAAKEGVKKAAEAAGVNIPKAKGIFGWLWGFLFGGVLSRGASNDSSSEGEFKDNRFILSRKDERLYFKAKDCLTFEEQKKMGIFERKMEESDIDFVFFRQTIANIQEEFEKSPCPNQSPATKRLKLILQASNFEEQKLIVGSSLGQKEFFKKDSVKKVEGIFVWGVAIVVGFTTLIFTILTIIFFRQIF